VSEQLRVSLVFDEARDPITGTLTVGGAQRPFTGWLGLIAALEAAITGRDPDASASTRPHERSWSDHDDAVATP
jgi:hypothetical protein